MTTTNAQWRELFGQPAVWETTLIRPPRNLVLAARAFLEQPELCQLATVCLDQLIRERRRPSAKPTKCLLCEANFLKAQPALIVIMRPATREGPAVSFPLCDDCAADPNHEQNIRARLHQSLGGQEVEWGTA